MRRRDTSASKSPPKSWKVALEEAEAKVQRTPMEVPHLTGISEKLMQVEWALCQVLRQMGFQSKAGKAPRGAMAKMRAKKSVPLCRLRAAEVRQGGDLRHCPVQSSWWLFPLAEGA